jgi:hypothetical protein
MDRKHNRKNLKIMRRVFHRSWCIFAAVAISGCASVVDLNGPRSDDNSPSNTAKRQDVAKLRAKSIADNETFFTDRLRCLGKSGQINDMALRVSVGPIYDKTAKVFPAGSTAISDMTINSLSYVQGLRIVETPLSGDISESRVNLLSQNYVSLGKGMKDNIVGVANKISHLPFGVLFPSQLHIAGALVQYDEGTETLSPTVGVDVDAFSVNRSVDTISVGLQLRLINSGDGEILTNNKLGKRGSVLLTTKFYKIKLDSSFFRLISSKQYGLDYSVTVEDPKQYVIREMVEKGVAELLSVLPNDENCGS